VDFAEANNSSASNLPAEVRHLLLQGFVFAGMRLGRCRSVSTCRGRSLAVVQSCFQFLRKAVVRSEGALVVAPLRLQHGSLYSNTDNNAPILH